MTEHNIDPSKRIAQRQLAEDVVELVHGTVQLKSIKEQSRTLFATSRTTEASTSTFTETQKVNSSAAAEGSQGSSTEDSYHTSSSEAENSKARKGPTPTNWENAPPPNLVLPRALVCGQTFSKVLFAAGLAESRTDGHRLIKEQGAYVGSCADGKQKMLEGSLSFTPIKHFGPEQPEKFLIDDELLILRKGKWKIKIIKVVPNEVFDEMGVEVPMWKEIRLLLNFAKPEKSLEDHKLQLPKSLKV